MAGREEILRLFPGKMREILGQVSDGFEEIQEIRLRAERPVLLKMCIRDRITVGKIKEKYLEQAIGEYSKRLSRYCKLEIIQVADEKTPDQASALAEEPVSYTHLDVYKRQPYQLPIRQINSMLHRVMDPPQGAENSFM